MKKCSRLLIAPVLLFALLAAAACGGGGQPAAGGAGEDGGNGAGEEAAVSQETFTLVMALHGTESHAYVPPIIEWAEKLKDDSGGRINIEIHQGGTLASSLDEVGLVQTGGADITFNTNSLSASLFKYGGIIAAFGEQVTNTMIGTHAVMAMYENEPAIKSEFDAAGLKCLAIMTQTPSTLGGKGAPVKTPAGWNGLSIQSISKNTIAIDEGWGASPIGVGVGDLYENFSKNVCKAALIDANLYSETRLYEEMDYLNTFNYNSSIAFLAMNLDKYNSLPDDLRALIDGTFDEISLSMATATNDYFINFVETVLPENNVELYDFDADMTDRSNIMLDTVIKAPYLKMMADEGRYDGQKIYDGFEKYIQEGKAKYGSEYDWFKSIH